MVLTVTENNRVIKKSFSGVDSSKQILGALAMQIEGVNLSIL